MASEMTRDYIQGHFARERRLLTRCGARELNVEAVTNAFIDSYGHWDPDLLDDDVYEDLIARHLAVRPA